MTGNHVRGTFKHWADWSVDIVDHDSHKRHLLGFNGANYLKFYLSLASMLHMITDHSMRQNKTTDLSLGKFKAWH